MASHLRKLISTSADECQLIDFCPRQLTENAGNQNPTTLRETTALVHRRENRRGPLEKLTATNVCNDAVGYSPRIFC